MITGMSSATRRTQFGQYLHECLQRADLTPHAFAGIVDASAGFVHDLMHGMRKPPKKNLHVWAQALKLDGPDLHKFFALALLERTPRAVRAVLEDYFESARRGGTLDVEWKRMYLYYQTWGSG